MNHLCLCDCEFQMFAHKNKQINTAHRTDNREVHSKNAV